MLNRLIFGVLLAAGLMFAHGVSGAYAVGGTSYRSATKADAKAKQDPDYIAAVRAVEGKDVERAIVLLTSVAARNSRQADAENRLGYSHRKLGNSPQASEHYKKALAIEPNHQGAHEYIGEAYLETNDLGMAQKHLKNLGSICAYNCEAYRDLNAAIKAYRQRKMAGA